ncbi:MAG: Rne/Rng family ribonuclease, partial [Rhodobacteraceae bacterium]|nr:Rne/Rng family ribonuclease [Paracoccaceae bacterium]
ESLNKRQLAGNIYLAKVTRVEPSLQAAFVDYGGNRHGFLAFSEIHPDYYQIPVADREALMAEERAYADALKARDEEEESKPTRPRRSRSRGRSSTKAATAKTDDAVETKEVEISGMETIDLTDDTADQDVNADSGVLETPEGSSPMDTVADTPVGEPVGDADASTAETTDAATLEVETSAEVEQLDENADAEPESVSTDEAAPEEVKAEEAVSEETSTEETPIEETSTEEASSDESAAEDTTNDDAESDALASEEADDDEPETKRSDAASKDDSIESVADEDDIEDIRPPRKPRARRYKIQEVIKVRQILLVQVVKEERGNKGAALTTYLSLAGRYCVLMPNTARGGGISRKITNAVDRKKLKEIAAEIDVPQGAGLIVRTAGAKRTKAEIKRDYEYLQRLWEQIRELTLKSTAPAKIYEEGDLIKRSIRDLYNREIDEVFVEGERGYRIAKDFMKMIMPSHAKNVKRYQETMPLFARYQVESYLGGMFNPTVQLKSGGYIVIDVTEALVAIDVNSGRATKENSIEDTALKTNLEAAEEVARQLRLRDLAGLIVIDFIDMDERKNNASVEKRIKDKLKTDRARIQIGRISGFGLMEMSRQRLRPGMIEATTQPCPSCHGTGLIRSDDNMALAILRQIEEEGVRNRSREVLVRCPVSIANFLMNQKREHVIQIENRYGLSVRIEGDPHLVSPDFVLEKFKTATRAVPVVAAPVVSVDTSLMDQIDADEAEEDVVDEVPEVQDATTTDTPDGEGKPKRRRRRRRRRSGKSNNGENGSEAENSGEESDNTASGSESTEEAAETPVVAEENTSSDAKSIDDTPTEDVKPKPKRTRSRSRSKPKAAEVEDTPAETTSSDEPVSAPAEEAGEEAEAKPKPKRKRATRSRAKAKAKPEVVAEPEVAVESANETPSAPTEPESVAEPVAAAEPVAVAEPEPVAAAESVTVVEPVAVVQPVAAPEPVVEAEPEAEQPAKPKRRGWWSLGR